MKKIVFTTLALIVIGGISYGIYHKQPVQVASVVPTGIQKPYCEFNEKELLDRFNSVRTHKLTVDTYLDKIAQDRADVIPFPHDAHAGFRTLSKQGVFSRYIKVSEILAGDKCPSTKRLFTQWSMSPPHWAAIKDESLDTVGIGFNQGTAVVIFGDTY